MAPVVDRCNYTIVIVISRYAFITDARIRHASRRTRIPIGVLNTIRVRTGGLRLAGATRRLLRYSQRRLVNTVKGDRRNVCRWFWRREPRTKDEKTRSRRTTDSRGSNTRGRLEGR